MAVMLVMGCQRRAPPDETARDDRADSMCRQRRIRPRAVAGERCSEFRGYLQVRPPVALPATGRGGPRRSGVRQAVSPDGTKDRPVMRLTVPAL